MAFLQTAALLGSLATSAYAHGRVTGISVVGGKEYTGFINDYLYTDRPPDIVAWSAQNGDNGFVDPTTYTTGDIICHHDGAPGKIAASVAAGGKIELQWGTDAWPESHHGPIIDYLAKCAGDDCTSVDKEPLEIFKIDQAGLIDGSSAPGQWASDELIAAMQRAQLDGGLPGVGLHVDDCRRTVEDLKSRGVEFLQEAEERPYGVEALMRDNSGNWMVLVEPLEYTPNDFDGVSFD